MQAVSSKEVVSGQKDVLAKVNIASHQKEQSDFSEHSADLIEFEQNISELPASGIVGADQSESSILAINEFFEFNHDDLFLDAAIVIVAIATVVMFFHKPQ